MLFNSYAFIFGFLPLVLGVYAFLHDKAWRRVARTWLVLSSFFFGRNPVGYTLGGFLIPAFAFLNLLPIPYMTHRGGRRMQTPVKFLVAGLTLDKHMLWEALR